MQVTFQHKPGDNEKNTFKLLRENKVQPRILYPARCKKQTMFAQTKKSLPYSCWEKDLKDVFREKKIKHRKERRSNKQWWAIQLIKLINLDESK